MIYITGMKHCGKTTVGRMVACALSVPFIDLDDIILETAAENTEAGPFESCRQLFEIFGREAFRDMEAKAAERLVMKEKDRPAVCALGGGTIENSSAYGYLKGTGRFVYIRESGDVLYKRVLSRGLPAYLDREHPYEDFIRLCSKREKTYAEAADITVEALGRSTKEIARETVERIREELYGS